LRGEDARETGENARIRGEKLLAHLDSNARILRGDDRMTDGDRNLTRHIGDDLGEVELLGLLVLHPGREPAELAVVAVVRKPHLGADEEDLLVEDDDAAIVDDVLVHDGPIEEEKGQKGRKEQQISKSGKGSLNAHSDVDKHTVSILEVEDLPKDLPRVELGVACRGEETRSAFCPLFVTTTVQENCAPSRK
jgi:hypothetical protein